MVRNQDVRGGLGRGENLLGRGRTKGVFCGGTVIACKCRKGGEKKEGGAEFEVHDGAVRVSYLGRD